jgi:ATP-dependent protease ClpP protease subunit
MKIIAIDGIIGWDVLATEFRKALAEADGDDVTLEINSPGGLVTEGIAIFNAIRDYQRKGSNVTARIVGMAASMASYIPLAANTVEAEDNAVYMIHNPWGISMGDYRTMEKEAKVLNSLASILASAYIKKTGKTETDIRGMMDEETYLYGSQIMDEGFADSITPAGDGPEDKEQAFALVSTSLDSVKKRLSERPENLDEIAAMLKTVPLAQKKETAPVTLGAGKQERKPMTKAELMREHPELFAEVVKEGVTQERDRMKKLSAYKDADPGNIQLAKVIDDAIASEKTMDEAFAQVQVAIRDGKKMDGENAPAVATATEVVANKENEPTPEETLLAQRLGIDVAKLVEKREVK